MDSSLTRQAVTPTRAKSAGPHRPYRDPMDDSDSSSTRKRPRLDSGNRAYRSMSADPSRTVSSDAGPVRTPVASPNGWTSPPSTGVSHELPPKAFTPSKVTINVREPAGNALSTSESIQVEDVPSLRGGGGGDEYPSASLDSSTGMDIHSPKIISVASSPSHSPEIEVAEVEDMNDDSAETRWKPLESATSVRDARDIQGVLLDQFPHGSAQSLRKTIALIAVVIQKNELGDGELFDGLAAWIELYLQTTEPLELQWWHMYQQEQAFWDEFPSLVEAMVQRRYTISGSSIHTRLLTAFRASNTRSGTIKMTLSEDYESFEGQSPLHNFLVAYTSLTLRMAHIDHQTLIEPCEDASTLPLLISERYIVALSNICSSSPFWKHLVDVANYDYKVTITLMMNKFMQPPECGVSLMTSMSTEILDRSYGAPTLINKVFVNINIVNHLMQHYNLLKRSSTENEKAMLPLLHGFPIQAYEFFSVVDKRFQEFISKQVPALSIDVSQGFVTSLSALLRQAAASDEQLMQRLMSEYSLSDDGLGNEESAHLLELAWKLRMLKKCIMDGRMEIRVLGVDTMQMELVSAYTKFISPNSTHKDHPIPHYLSDFMLSNKLVDYFVGVDSHPQLISRCGNIIGFLLVANRYSEAESDIIWNAVTCSQDSRFVDAILTMLPNIFNIAPYPVLLYMTTKLNQLPIHAFDGNVIKFSRMVLDHLRKQWKYDPSKQNIDMPPFHLCIRLIRQSAVEGSLETSRKREIHHFAVAELTNFLHFGPCDADRRAIYQECIQDISNRTEYATGSISAINVFLLGNSEKEIISLTKECDMASLVVKEFAHMIENQRSTATLSLMLREQLESRLSLIQVIVFYVPDTITTDVGTRLWNYTVGSEALNDTSREIAWMNLIKVIRALVNRNSFIDQCVREHLPRLQPRFFTMGCLHLAQEVSHYHFRSAISQPHNDVKQETTAEDLLWHLSLTAPPGDIEHKAIVMLVTLFLDSPENQRRTRATIEAIHINVVERCVRQLTSAASKLKSFSDGTSSGEDEPMVIVVSDDEVQVQRLVFSRSLTILKEFIKGVRFRLIYSPQTQSQPQLPQSPREAIGNVIQIRYQCFGGSASQDIRTLEVGDLETLQDLVARLKHLAQFQKLMLVSGGQKLDVAKLSSKTVQELRLDQKGLLLVKKDSDTETVPQSTSAKSLRPVEAEVLTHFSELYQLLGMEDGFGREVLDFLVEFPPHESITTLVCSVTIPLEMMFPPSVPYKILYSIFALQSCLESQIKNPPIDPNLVNHGIKSLTAALSMLNLRIGSEGCEVDTVVAVDLLQCLVDFLQALETTPYEGTEALFTNSLALLRRFQALIEQALAVHDSSDTELLASTCFTALLKISTCSEGFWKHFRNANLCSKLLRRLLLEGRDWQIRRRVGDDVKSICTALNSMNINSAEAFIPHIWSSVVTVIPYTLHVENTSQEFFDLASILFRSFDHTYLNSLDLALYVRTWSNMLLRHKHHEFVGRESIDWIVFGLSNLLNLAFQHAKSVKNTLPTPDGLLVNLFHTHLFPEISNFYNYGPVETQVPNLHSNTRHELYSIILVLSNDMDDYQNLLMLVKNLLSQGEGSLAWSWGIAQTLEDYHFDPNWNFERNKTIRSPVGYPGMRNLSNTCYMNSLFTQLFMNVKFRGFMLGMHVADAAASQKLLHETQALFGFMQETMLRSVDSQGIADSLITYDNALIDVSVQMDVDEFYNLLFDRWEAQILLGADKKNFRGFYGGQIVQQIKSKECPHISERLEPFSAIQCDIHGKATLMDSLNAYVSGETMEGDNKYSCTSCGCYVDAVKRACLRDIPDNLIFHLKRFDYDVMTGMRSKINDVFEFPHQIDMAPYHVDSQTDTGLSCVPDMFELVGVLVHSGTAESGHYYSYIRERPSTFAGVSNWVEFNDMDVTKFDPNHIPDQCFGGYTEASHYAHRFQKNWNAYMLFYERVEPKNSDQGPLPTSTGIPVKCPVPVEIESQVAVSNEQWLRNYCMYDPAHANFARLFLEQLRTVNKGICSDDHVVEKEAIWLSLEYLERVLSRCRDSSEFSQMLASLSKVIGSCAVCCKLALDWVRLHDYALRNLLLRCPNAKVRKDFATMIVMTLQYLRKHEPQWYGFQDPGDGDSQSSSRELRQPGLFALIVARLGELWNTLPSHARGWDDYFGLFSDLALLGAHEIHVMLNRGLLRGCLEILVVEHAKASRLRSEHSHYAQYHRLLDKGRRFSLNKLVELLATLLERVDLGDDWVPRMCDRHFSLHREPLIRDEDELMQLGSDMPRSKSLCIFLEKILNSGCNQPATQKIVKQMTLAEPRFSMLEVIQKTIMSGINVEPAHLAEPFLQAAITFCEATPSEGSAREVIRFIAGEVNTIGDYGGQEHLNFFAQARRLASLRDHIEPGFFNHTVLRAVPQWAPALLHFRDEAVRHSTVDLLKHLVFGHDLRAMDDEEHAELIETAAKDLQVACTRRCIGLVQLQKPVDSKIVEQIMQVIKYCLTNYYAPDEDRRAISEANNVLAALEILTISDVDDAASDIWNNGSDDLPTDSDSEFLTTSP